MKKGFFKSLAALLAVLTAFAGLPLSAYAARMDALVPQGVTETAVTENDSTEATEATNPDEEVLNVPEITSFANTPSGTKITWTQYSGAAKYRVYLFNGTKWKIIGESKTLSFLHSPLKNLTTYLYTVRALDDKNNYVSSYSKQGFENTFYAPPVISSVANVFDGVSVRWENFDGIEKYLVYRRTDSSKGWKRIGTCEGNSYVDTTALSGTKYSYTVRCLDRDDNLISSHNSGKSIKYVKAPQITKLVNTVSGTKITWTKSQGAAKYRVFRLDSSNVWRVIGTTSATSYTHDKLKAGATNKYTVRCIDSKGNFISAYDKVGVSNTFVAPPTVSSLTNVFDGVQVKWGVISNAAGYLVYRRTDNSTGWKRIGTCEGSTYVDTTALPGTRYSYTVRCLDRDDNLISSYNSGKSIKYIKAPQITKLENLPTGTKITWTKSQGAAKYRVFSLDSSNVWRVIGTTSATSFTHDKLKAGTTYKYTVRCIDNKGNFISAYDKTGKENLFIAPPAISKISSQFGRNLIEWELVDGADSYRLYRKTVGASSWSRVADINGTWYLDPDTKEGYAYTYTLRCLDKDGNLISSYVSNTKYYVDGELANGKVTQDGKTYTFSNGLFRSGYQTIGGAKYYYNSSGVLQKNGIVGSDKDGWCYADKNGKVDFTYSNGVTQHGKDWNVMEGKATKVVTEADRTLFRALKIVHKITKKSMTKSEKLKVCFDYVKKAYTEKNPRIPHFHGKDWQIIYANDMFVNGVGNCFSYACAFAYLAKAIGYKEVYCCNSGGHGWAEINGLVYDPEWSRHRFQYTYYGLSYNTTTDVDYKAGIAPGYSWMHVKI